MHDEAALCEGIDAEIARAAQILCESAHPIALTGAGLSVESGIPPFRGPGGLWTKYGEPPMDGYQRFLRDPVAHWRQRLCPTEGWLKGLRDTLARARPNPGHSALAELERDGRLACVITQNIDDLHRQAGSRELLEIHGNARLLRCIGCVARFGRDELEIDPERLPPRCPHCGGIVKDDTVQFGEPIPPDVLRRCFEEVERADTMLVAGTSATVFPAADFPLEVLRRGGAVIEVNAQRRTAEQRVRDPCSGEAGDREPRLAGLLRSLLSGIPFSERAERVDVSEHRLGDCPAVRIHNANGRIHVIGEERDAVELRAHKRARAESTAAAERLLDEIAVEAAPGGDGFRIDVQIPKRWNRRGSVNLEVRVPRLATVSTEATNGKLLIEGLRSRVRARSCNGPVTVEDVVGDVEVYASNGKVSCADTCGRLVAWASCGKIELTEHRGSVDASTSNGFIRATLEHVGAEGVRLSTSNGRIVLELPETLDADVDLHVDNGVIRNDRELQNATRAVNGRVRGVLGKGGVPIRLRCSNGSVSLR